MILQRNIGFFLVLVSIILLALFGISTGWSVKLEQRMLFEVLPVYVMFLMMHIAGWGLMIISYMRKK